MKVPSFTVIRIRTIHWDKDPVYRLKNRITIYYYAYTDYLGIDISKQTFDVVNKSGKHYQLENSTKGFFKIQKNYYRQ